MPRICEFYGVVVYMYYNDHEPPHFHVRYGGYHAKVGIDQVHVIDGQLPPRTSRMVLEWAAEHQPELRENWRLARAKRALSLVNPVR